METISTIWGWVNETVPAPSLGWSLLALAVGAILACTPAVWRKTRLLATYVHEAGHATVALAFGRRVTAIRLEADSSGTTDHIGPVKGIGRFLTAFAGYPAPALAGVGLIAATSTGHQRWAIAGGIALVTLLSLVQRSWRGWLITIILLSVTFLLVQTSGGALGGVLLLLMAGYLLASSPRTIVELHQVRARGNTAGEPVHSDADALAQQTHIPALVWEGIFMVAVAGCLYWCFTLLF